MYALLFSKAKNTEENTIKFNANPKSNQPEI